MTEAATGAAGGGRGLSISFDAAAGAADKIAGNAQQIKTAIKFLNVNIIFSYPNQHIINENSIVYFCCFKITHLLLYHRVRFLQEKSKQN